MAKVTHDNERQCVCLLGRQRVGKSSLTAEIIANYKKKKGAVKVLAPHPDQFGKDGVLCDVTNVTEIVESLMGEFQGLVVFDDADTYMNPRSGPAITSLCSSFRHYNIDLIVSSRAPQTININMRRCFSRICVFMMHEPRAIHATRELLGEFKEEDLVFPKEPFLYNSYNLETYEVTREKTKRMTT